MRPAPKVDQARVQLSALDGQQGTIVEMRFFAGFSIEEAAAVLGTSPTTVKREWVVAKAWLIPELRRGHLDNPASLS